MGYLYACDAFEIPAKDPKREAPEILDSPVPEATPDEEEEGDAEDTPDPKKSADGTPQEQTTPPENIDNATINLSP